MGLFLWLARYCSWRTVSRQWLCYNCSKTSHTLPFLTIILCICHDWNRANAYRALCSIFRTMPCQFAFTHISAHIHRCFWPIFTFNWVLSGHSLKDLSANLCILSKWVGRPPHADCQGTRDFLVNDILFRWDIFVCVPGTIFGRDVTDSKSASVSDGIRHFSWNPISVGHLNFDRNGFKIFVSVQLYNYLSKKTNSHLRQLFNLEF